MYWLMKSEPSEFSIDDLVRRRNRTAGWSGVRNYQARNMMLTQMQVGDQAFFYHSSCEEPGIYGIVEICRAAYPDETQFDARSRYFDPASRHEAPRWYQVDVRFLSKTRYISLKELRSIPGLSSMRVLQRGNRLSITPVTADEWRIIVALDSGRRRRAG